MTRDYLQLYKTNDRNAQDENKQKRADQWEELMSSDHLLVRVQFSPPWPLSLVSDH